MNWVAFGYAILAFCGAAIVLWGVVQLNSEKSILRKGLAGAAIALVFSTYVSFLVPTDEERAATRADIARVVGACK